MCNEIKMRYKISKKKIPSNSLTTNKIPYGKAVKKSERRKIKYKKS